MAKQAVKVKASTLDLKTRRRLAAPDRTLMLLLGKRLEQLALEYDGDITAFLARAGIPQNLFDDIVVGAGNVTCATMEKVAKNLGLSIFELLGLSDNLVREQLATIDIDLGTLSDSHRTRAKPAKNKNVVPALV